MKLENVQELKFTFHNGINYYYLSLIPRGVFCKKCNMYIKKIHGYKNERINHSIFIKEECMVIYRHRRYYCKECCCTTMEATPFKSNHPKVSLKTIDNVCKLLKDYNHTYASVSREVSLSPTLVQTIFDEHVQIPRHPLPEALCIDEIYFCSKENKDHGKYICVLINFKNGMIIDILKSRHKEYLRSYFRMIPENERKRVKFISLDMNDTYRDIAKHYLPNALICCDAFHVIQNIHRVLDDIRIVVLNRYEDNKKSHEYYLLKHKYRLLFKSSDKVAEDDYKRNKHFGMTYSSGQLLRKTLEIDKTLKLAYDLKENYLIFNTLNTDAVTIQEMENILDTLITEYEFSGINKFYKLSNTFKDWRQEILNSFTKYDNRKISNGPIEGRNKYLKIIIKLANGYTNFKRYRNRSMYVLNKYEPYNKDNLDPSNVKKIGNERGRYKKHN